MLVHIMIGMSMTVPSMHQQMQQGAQEEQQVREHAGDMRPVWGGSINTGDGEESDDRPFGNHAHYASAMDHWWS